jgi:hypothetical protein
VHWRRISETWSDPDLGDPELVFQLAGRLTEYVQALEPYRAGTFDRGARPDRLITEASVPR